jgi:hypothetical protein
MIINTDSRAQAELSIERWKLSECDMKLGGRTVSRGTALMCGRCREEEK